MAQKQRKKSRKYIKRVKSFLYCQNCELNCNECLEFHHLKDKKFTIANASEKSIKTIKQEIRKCIVLCSSCHRELHFLENNKEYKNLKLHQIVKKELEKISKIRNLKTCKYCEKEFHGTKMNRLYCSDKCQVKNTKIRKKKEYLENYRNNIPHKKSKQQLLKEKRIRNKDLKNSIRKYILNFKFENGCTQCKDKRWFCLDFHHKHDKYKGVSKMISQGYSLKKIKQEISKCEILCANCHKKQHVHA